MGVPMDSDKAGQAPMDAEDLGIEMDKMDKEQQGKSTVIDQSKVQADIAAAKTLASQGKLQQAIDALLLVEKAGRTAEDYPSTSLACTTILELLHSAGQWKQLMETIQLLSKRRSQLKQATKAMVKQAMSYIDSDASKMDHATRTEMIETLVTLTEGKIFVEIERARLTRLLAHMKEAEGKIAEAAELLQEIAVETYGSMSKTEKISFILEQVRLCLDRGDYVRAQIMARKISPRAFASENLAAKAKKEAADTKDKIDEDMTDAATDDLKKKSSRKGGEQKPEIGIEGTAVEPPPEGTASLEQLKLQYHGLMIRYYAHTSDYLEIARAYRSILDTPIIEADATRAQDTLAKAAWYCVLSPVSSDQATLLELTKQDKRMEDLPGLSKLLKGFSGNEILWWRQMKQDMSQEMADAHDIFGGTGTGTTSTNSVKEGGGGEGGGAVKRKEDLRVRVTQHNILVISKYYSRISAERLAQMLELTPSEAEKCLSDMVVSGAVAAKIDRPAGVVTFGAKKGPGAALNSWSGNVSKLLELVEKSCQAIQKEVQVHKVELSVGS